MQSKAALFDEVFRLCEQASISDVVDTLTEVCRCLGASAGEPAASVYEDAARKLEALDSLFV